MLRSRLHNKSSLQHQILEVFNKELGDRLVSGSDDRRLVLWNVANRYLVLSYDSDHADNVLQARIMPFSDASSIVTSATDGQVRLGQVADNSKVQTKILGEHNGHVHKLAVERGSPYILYSYGEDGLLVALLYFGNCVYQCNDVCTLKDNIRKTDAIKGAMLTIKQCKNELESVDPTLLSELRNEGRLFTPFFMPY
ncbi:hypothetical protein M8C21_023711, partial [Ambrosia artemisiifolia]